MEAVKKVAVLSGGRDAQTYDAETEFESIALTPIRNPILEAHDLITAGKATVREAWLYEGRFNEAGSILREAKTHRPDFRMTRVVGTDAYKAKLAEADVERAALPVKAQKAREAQVKRAALMAEAKAKGLVKESFDEDTQTGGPYDPGQYTEYAPLYSGPYNKQLYLYDYLQMHSRAFEAWNHKAPAKRVINILAQYVLGRGFKTRIKNDAPDGLEEKWNAYLEENDLESKLRKFWVREYLIYGELMVDKPTLLSIDPSTVWDVIGEPDRIDRPLYYHQQYSTAYFQFTGKQVPGVPGSAKTAPIEYIIRQIPAEQVIHIKGNCVSNEKRGRSVIFPVLGWIKRAQDLYNAIVIKAQLEASMIWDDEVDGGPADIAAHLSAYSGMPPAGSTFVHNKAVKRTPMPAMQGAGRGGSMSGVGDELLAFIAMAMGIPKEHMNVLMAGGGSRATALVSSEPFTKVIEDLQADIEDLLHAIAKAFCEANEITYTTDLFEFIFPSVTKDTTTETIKNIAMAESQGWISKRTAATMGAAELNITRYDFEEEQKTAQADEEAGLNRAATMLPPDGRFGQDGQDPAQDETGAEDKSPVRGEGRVALQKDLNRL